MHIEIPHEHHDGRPLLTVSMVIRVNGVPCRVIDSDERHVHLQPVTAEREVSDM